MPYSTGGFNSTPYGGYAPLLSAHQYWFNGLTMGEGTQYEVIQIKGLDELPDIIQTDLKIDRDWGDYMGPYFSKGRDISLQLEVHDTTDSAFRSDLDALGLATAPQPLQESIFSYLQPGFPQLGRQVWARSHHRAQPIDINYVFRKARVEVSLYATDPRIYDISINSLSVGLPTGTGGTSWPVTWPLSWGTAAPGGTMTCLNAGTIETRPILSIAGPIDNPTVQNVTTGQSISFGLTLGSTDTLTIDMLNKVVQLNGGGNLRGSLSSGYFWGLPPGSNTVQFSANTTKTGSQLTVKWASAWL